ncbi:MAG: FG-GAP repeat domain-containing protein [Planctomycetota bacterium]
MTLLAAAAAPQEILWETVGQGFERYSAASAFGDYDGDGWHDLLTVYSPDRFAPSGASYTVRILSGRDGGLLWTAPGTPPVVDDILAVRNAGDMDGDGSPDFAAIRVLGHPYQAWRLLEIWSPARNAQLWWAAGAIAGGFGSIFGESSAMAGDLDVNGDGRPDFVVLSPSSRQHSKVSVYDNSGALMYELPFHAFSSIAYSVAAMPDLDGDGGDDFVVGVLQPVGGGVVVVSGRTGSVIRLTGDIHVGDVLGGAVANAGDVDGDGTADYAAASYWSSPLTNIAIFSGRTGAVLRQWNDYWTNEDLLIGDIDVDLDGIPDLVVPNGGFPHAPNVHGQVRVYAGRDASVLWNYDSVSQSDYLRATGMWSLGAQPDSPYPVLVSIDWNWNSGRGRILAMRTNLRGAGPVVGTAGSSTGDLPQIGMRLVPGHARITVAEAPPGALAWLALAGADDTNSGGLTVPAALDPLGLIGCTAYVPPFLVAPTIVGTAGADRGYAAVDLPVPGLSPAGIPFAAQWLVLDPATGAFATSARHEFRAP